MKIILCLDEKRGMLFNHRRQSRDRIVRQDIMDSLRDAGLWMNAYSYKQFTDVDQSRIMVDEEFLDQAGERDYCFVEDRQLLPYETKISELIIYYWNKTYPADLYLDLDLSRWREAYCLELVGYSHEKITKKIYVPQMSGNPQSTGL